MTNEIVKFEYEQKEIRTLTDEYNETWFVAKDICEILNLSNVSRAMDRLDEDEKLTLPLVISGQSRPTWITNESGFYHLVLTSEKSEAKEFRKWVTQEVLPAIRKAGKYSTEEANQREESIQHLIAEIEQIEYEVCNLKQDVTKKKNLQEQKEVQLRQLLKSDFRQYKLQLESAE